MNNVVSFGKRIENAGTLRELLEVLRESRMLAPEYRDAVDWGSLPLFGGPEPADTQGVWSWDETHLLVGTCANDLEIVSRESKNCSLNSILVTPGAPEAP